MRNLVPHFILEQYARGESGGRFPAVSLFVDISGFSATTHALMQHGSEAAEAMADVMRAIFTPLVEHVHAQGGFVTTFAGDAFTALFPLEGGTDAYRRALAAAIAIQGHMVAQPVQVTRYGRFPFAIKLGLGDGTVEWGILRPARASPQRAQNAAYFFGGPAIEAAAAAEHQAQAGNLVLSPAVYAAVATTAAATAAVQVLPLADGYARYLKETGELPAPQSCPEVTPLDDAEAAFLPAAIRQRTAPGDFRQVVAVFIQLLGIATRQDLDIFMQAVFDLLAQFDGYLNRVDFGDKGCNLLLYWGMPTSHENDVPRALDFVLELGNHTPATFRAGLTYAPMYAGLAGSAERGEYTCYGDGVNLAAHLMQAAPWGSIWLDEHLAGRARRHFVVEYVDHQTFKGYTEKQAVHALVERRPAGESFFAGPLVGREAELAALHTFVQPLFTPAGQPRYAGILAVVGEAGLGKSRLIHEFRSHSPSPRPPVPRSVGEGVPGSIGDREISWFLCQTDSVLRQPLNPFRYWLRGYFDQSPAQSVERNKRAFNRKLDQLLAAASSMIAAVEDAALAQELQRTRSCLGALVGLEWDGSLYARLDPKGRYENTLQALKALLKVESLRQPVVLVLEDAHWLDEDSQEFLRRLERQIETYPLAVLLTARSERVGALLGPGYSYRQLDLACLSPAELERLAADRLGGPAAPEVLALLAQRAESNPFFAEQILLYLREQGRLACREGTWGLAATGSQLPLPDEVRAIFVARLDRLAQEIRAVVQAAAILGREFEVRVLAAMLRAEEQGERLPEDLSRQVAAAEQEAVWAALTELRYLFKHVLLRDAAYEMQLQARRRELHRLAAAALERLYAEDVAPHDGEIAYHYEAACRQGLAEVRPQACAYLEQAGRRAAARYENAAAVDLYSRALALTPAEAEEQRLRLLLGREAVYHLLGRREEQRADLQALQEMVPVRQRPAEQAELALRQARLANATGDYAAAAAAAAQSVAAAQVAGAVGLEADAQLKWCVALYEHGDYPAANEHGQAGLLLAQAAGRADLQGEGLRNLGVTASYQSDYATACRYYEQALATFEETGNRRGESGVLNSLGNTTADLGDYVAAGRYYERALAIFWEIGDRWGGGRALVNLGTVSQNQGDYAAARRRYEQALTILEEVGDHPGEGAALNNLGIVARFQGDYAAARRYYEQALAIKRETGEQAGESRTLGNLGAVAQHQGDYAAAHRYFEQSLAICRKIGDRRAEGRTFDNLGNWAFCKGDYTLARRHFEQALAISREIGDRQSEGIGFGNLGKVASSQGDGVAAHREYEQALAIFRQTGHRRDESIVLNALGYLALAQDTPTAACGYFEQALEIGRELKLAAHIAESLTGLARAALTQGEQDGARAYVLEMLSILEANPRLDGIDNPRRTLLNCVQVLLALGDARGREILAAAHARLLEQAAHMEDEAARRMFLENVPENRALVAEFARLMADQAAPAAEAAAQPLAPQEEAGPPVQKGKKKQKKGKKKDRPKEGKKKKKSQEQRGQEKV